MDLRGRLARVVYARENFMIGKVRLDGGGAVEADSAEACVVGAMISPQLHADYTFCGKWTTHPRFGRQFAFDSYTLSYPTSTDALLDYLTELPHFGASRAAAAMEAFGGEHVIEVLRTDPRRVADTIPGLGEERAAAVAAYLSENENIEKSLLDVKTMLAGAPLGRPQVRRIIGRWGAKAPEVIRSNPYRLTEIHGIGWLSADVVARHLGMSLADPRRVFSGMRYVLEDAASGEGHTCLPCGLFLARAARLLGLPDESMLDHLAAAHLAEVMSVVLSSDEPPPPDGGTVALPAIQRAESDIARYLRGLLAFPAREEIAPALDGLAPDQVAAVACACRVPVMLLTGAPGTGKTFAVDRILCSLRAAGLSVALCAPTGKAAKRITEMTGAPASTIHSLLRPEGGDDDGGWRFQHGPDNPIPARAVIVDEASMVDARLAADLLSALRAGTRLIMVGDHHQLPSVGAGDVLRQLLSCGLVPHVELTEIKRQDAGLIVRNCHRIKDGQPILTASPGGPTDPNDFRIEEIAATVTEDGADLTLAAIRARIVDLVVTQLPTELRFQDDPTIRRAEILRRIQVIGPLREKTALGCAAINKALQEALNPERPENTAPAIFPAGARRFRIGDKVIRLKNDVAGLGVVNGDVGYITGWGGLAQPGCEVIVVGFEAPERIVEIPAREHHLDLGYALTCHKFQGSEADAVVIPMHRCFGSLIVRRNWIYTAISRARRLCIIVGSEAALRAGCRRGRDERFSRLAAFLRTAGAPAGR